MMSKFYSKKDNFLILSLLVLTLYCLPIMANSSTTEKILNLLKNQQIDKAFQLASQHADDYEGDSNFDLAFALAARAAGKYHQAVFAFERVLFVNPHSIDARFGLATTYYLLNNFKAANTELSLLSKYKLSPQLSETVKQYVDAIAKKTLEANGYWRHWIRGGVGSDSNANNGSTDEFITLPQLGQVRLFDESREVKSSFYDIQGQTLYVKPLNQLSTWYVSTSLLHVGFSDKLALSKTFASFFTGYQTRIKSYDVNVSLFYRPLWLDSDNFLDYYGGKFGVTRKIWRDNTFGVDYSHSFEDYNQETLLNKQQSLVETWLEKPLYNGSHRFTLKLAKETADLSSNDFSGRDFWGLGYSLKQSINTLWNYKVSIDYLAGEHNAPDKVFNIVRDDKFIRAELDIGYQYNFQFRLLSKVSYLNNSSNLPLYEFSRYKFWFGLQYEF